MNDIQKKDLIDAIHNACDALHALEMEADHVGSVIAPSQPRDMLDALEEHLRKLTPEVYS